MSKETLAAFMGRFLPKKAQKGPELPTGRLKAAYASYRSRKATKAKP